MNQDLQSYIKTQLAKGANRDIIESELLKTGWKQQDIDAGFQTINNPAAIKPSRISYRISALLIDGLILGIPVVLVIFILNNVLGLHINLSSLNQTSISQKGEAIKSLNIVLGFVFYAVSVIYYVLFHVNKGASIGKSVYGLRLVQYKTNNTLTYTKAIPRELIKNGVSLILVIGGLVYFVNGLITLFSDEKRGLHDMAVNSQVIEVTKPWSLGKQVVIFIPLLLFNLILFAVLFSSLISPSSRVITVPTSQLPPIPNSIVSPTPNISSQEFKFDNNQVIFNFIPNNPMTVTQKDVNTFILDKDNPIRSYTIIYYQSKGDFLKNQVYTKNSDGNSAGQGCFYDEKSDIVINNTHFNQLQCYYNPIDKTKTGNYIPSTSVLSNNYCVYNLGAQGVIYFGGTLPVDSNGCNIFFKTDLKSFEILNTIGWKTYTDSNIGFTIKYPQDWREDDKYNNIESPFNKVLTLDPPCDYGCGGRLRGIYFYVDDNKNNLSLINYLNQVVIPGQQGCGNVKIVTNNPVDKNYSIITRGYCGAGSPGLVAYISKGSRIIELFSDGIEDNTVNSIFSTFKFTQ